MKYNKVSQIDFYNMIQPTSSSFLGPSLSPGIRYQDPTSMFYMLRPWLKYASVLYCGWIGVFTTASLLSGASLWLRDIIKIRHSNPLLSNIIHTNWKRITRSKLNKAAYCAAIHSLPPVDTVNTGTILRLIFKVGQHSKYRNQWPTLGTRQTATPRCIYAYIRFGVMAQTNSDERTEGRGTNLSCHPGSSWELVLLPAR